jgi:hypothetical protein
MLILRVALYVLIGGVVGLAAGTPALAAAGAASGPQDALHEVMAGDNLHLIAGYYYGDARLWEKIWTANKAQVKNPNVIERGMLLLIPNASVPDTPYPEFAAWARREAAARAAEKAAGTQTEAAPVEKEVRVMGEDKPAAPAGGSTPPAGVPAASPAAPAKPAAPAPGGPPPAKAQPRPPAP